MFEVRINGLKKYMDSTLVLEDVTFEAYSGEKVGLVGENGSGKSTILKLIAGVLPMHYYPGYPQTSSYGYDEGFVCIPKEAQCAYLEQIPDYNKELTVMDVLRLAFCEVYSMEENLHKMEEQLTLLSGEELDRRLRQYGELTSQYEAMGGYETEEKLNRICTGLKFDEDFLNRRFYLLSGGEKTTVLLGKLLMDQPDILLLDEPTNHLDIEAVQWLEGYLKQYTGIVIVVSHDRYFLDHVVDKIVEIEDKHAMTYRGNYTTFVEKKEEMLRVEYEHYLEQQKKVASMERTIKELRDWAIRADNNKFFKRAASMQNKLDRMERIKRPKMSSDTKKLNIKEAGRSGNEVVIAKGLCKSYEDKVIFKDADFFAGFKERVALVGKNGCGKTTFIKMLLGEEKPDNGEVRLGASIKMAYLPQNFTFNNEDFTVLECFREDYYILEGKAREYLAKYMFYGSSVFKKVKHLSGGERIRLLLAKLLYEEVNLLILDEPTNHLDIPSIESLEETLSEFDGTVLFISHDRYLINRIAKRVVEIEDTAFHSYSGNYDAYKENKEKRNIPSGIKHVAIEKKEPKKRNRNPEKKKEDDAMSLEQKIASLEEQLKDVEAAMEDGSLDYTELSDLYGRKEALAMRLDLLMEQWMEMAQ